MNKINHHDYQEENLAKFDSRWHNNGIVREYFENTFLDRLIIEHGSVGSGNFL